MVTDFNKFYARTHKFSFFFSLSLSHSHTPSLYVFFMKINTASFPPEILVSIFKRMPRQTQIQCQQVCKAWYNPARQLIYATVATGTKDVSKLIYCLEASAAGVLVKHLQLDELTNISQEQLMSMISACPNSQHLRMSNDYAILKWMADISQSVTLDHLRSITPLGQMSWRLNQHNSYFYLVAHHFRQSIESLYIPCACSPVIDSLFGSTMKYLAAFSRLKDLTLIDGSMNNMIYLNELLNICPKLEKLNMQLGHPLFNPEALDQSDTAIKPYSTLHTLDFFLPGFLVDSMRYMIHRLVGLKVWNIRINQDTHDWELEKERVDRFLRLEYKPFVSQLQASSLALKSNGSSGMSDFFAHHTPLVECSALHAHFQLENSRSERTDIVLETDDQHVSFAKYVLIKDFSYGPIDLPYTKHLLNYGSQMTTLTLKLGHSIPKAVDLGFILNECINVKEVHLEIARTQPREYHWCSLLQRYDSQPNIVWDSQEAKVCQISLLKIHGGMITASLLEQMALCTPHLVKLSLMSCNYEPAERGTNMTTFSMSNLNLDEFELDTCMLYQPDYQFTQIIITNQSGSQTFYYIFDKLRSSGHWGSVSETQFKQHCSELEQGEQPLVILRFVFKTVDRMKVHVGKYYQQQVIETIPLLLK